MDSNTGAQIIINDLNKVREIITKPENLALHVAADWDEMAKLGVDLEAPWSKLVITEGVPKKK